MRLDVTTIKPIELFLSIDLEMNQPSKKIIQIGAVIGNVKTGEVLERFSAFVDPQEPLGMCNDGDEIGRTITELTGITDTQLKEEGTSLEEAYTKLVAFCSKYKPFINPLTWGGGDTVEILDQLAGSSVLSTHPWPFGRRWVDVKTLFVSWRIQNGRPIQGGLAKSMTKVGLKFEGRKHNATDDAFNTFRMYCAMLNLFKKDSNNE